MYFKIRIHYLLITLLLFTNVKASQYTVSVPHVQKLDSGYQIIFRMTNYWDPTLDNAAFDSRTKKFTISWVPWGKDRDDANNLLSLQNFRTEIETPLYIATKYKELYREKSPDSLCTSSTVDISDTVVERGYNTIRFKIECANNVKTNRPDVRVLKIFDAIGHMFIIERSWNKIPNNDEIQNGWAEVDMFEFCNNDIEGRECFPEDYNFYQ